MSADEEFTRALRKQVDAVAPSVDVDTSRVIPRARRRRRGTRARGVAGTLVMVAGIAWAVASMPSVLPPASDVTPTPYSGSPLESEVIPETAVIVFPGDRFQPSREESALLLQASVLVTAECAQARGVDWRAMPMSPYSSVYDASNYFGVWTVAIAREFAFSPPMTERDLLGDDAPISAEQAAVGEANTWITEAEQAIVHECASPESNRFSAAVSSSGSGEWNAALEASTRGFDTNEDVLAAYADLNACFRDVGLEPDADPDSRGFPLGADAEAVDDEQIALALQVVYCKTQVDFVPRLAAIMAALQAPVIEQYLPDLTAQRGRIDEAVAEARELIAANGL